MIWMHTGMCLLGFILNQTLHFLVLGYYFLSHVRQVFYYDHVKHFLQQFLFLLLKYLYFKYWYVIMFPRGVWECLHFFPSFFFSFIHSAALISMIMTSRSLIYSSTSVILLLVISSVFFISIFVLLISVCSLVLLGLC